MITIKDIVMEPNEDSGYAFNHGYINKPLKIFGQLRFEEKEERLGLTLPKKVKAEEVLDKLKVYLQWLEDCKEELTAFYKSEFEYDIREYFDGEMTPDWFDTLEVYSGTVSLGENGTFGADFSTGDNMDEDHLLIIEIDGKEIISMWHDG